MFAIKKINIPTKHLVPFVLAGLNALSMLVLPLFLCDSAADAFNARQGPIVLGFSTLMFCVSYGLIRWILGPLERFLEKSRQNPAIPASFFEEQGEAAASDVHNYERFLEKITDFIDKTDAQTLFPDILAQSRIMRGLMSRILKVAPSDTTVLITGESGTGKELVAKAVVEHSQRADKPYIKVNCAAIPESLLESELFGHEKGAYTGAVSARAGKFEMADKGTVFLDEIGDMPLAVQAKLLRVLQEKEIQRLGGGKTLTVDLRIIVATNKDLEALVAAGLFREDLYFRINVFRLDIPPLRARREDIPILAAYFADAAPSPKKIAHDAMDALTHHAWPGNVRELRNTIERACLTCRYDMIHTRDLEIVPSEAGTPIGAHEDRQEVPMVADLDLWLAEAEKNIIIAALKQCDGVQARAAQQLNIKERSLWHRVKKYRIDAKAYKPQV